MNYEDGKMTSIKLKGDQLKLALLMGRGNMSAGLKVCLYVVDQLLHQDADLERLHTIVRNRIGVSPQELADQLKHTSAAMNLSVEKSEAKWSKSPEVVEKKVKESHGDSVHRESFKIPIHVRMRSAMMYSKAATQELAFDWLVKHGRARADERYELLHGPDRTIVG